MSVPKAGALVKASDWSTVFPLDTDAWPTYVPVWTQGATTITYTANVARYIRVGRWVHVSVSLVATGAGSASDNVGVTLPITGTGDVHCAGDFWFNDNGTAFYAGAARKVGSGSLLFYTNNTTAAFGETGSIFSAAVAVGDNLEFSIDYEAAS